jgi:N-acetylglucosaminyldiphosphoundecaprenol N-acetyl-beta-D-mannosaminyltransferase
MLSACPGGSLQDVSVLGLRVAQLSMADIAALVVAPLQSGDGLKMVVTANVDHVVTLHSNPRFRDAYRGAWIVTIDGTPIFWYAKMRGIAVDKVTGADLFPEIMRRLRPGVHRPYFICSNCQTGEAIVNWLLREGFDRNSVGFFVPDFGFEKDAHKTEQVVNEIRRLNTTHLFLGIGAPKSEIWISENRHLLGDVYAFGVGAALNFFAGTVRRAPAAFRNAGVEWLWRVVLEPRRLALRYVLGALRILPIFIHDLTHRAG